VRRASRATAGRVGDDGVAGGNRAERGRAFDVRQDLTPFGVDPEEARRSTEADRLEMAE
jgi:hypothetical protein